MGSFVDRSTEPADLESMLLAIRQINRERADLISAARVGRFGHWSWDFDRDEVIASDELCRLHGLGAGALDGTLEGFLAHVHLEDRAWTKQVLRTSTTTRQPFDHQHRIVCDDGTIRMLEIRAEIDASDDGRPPRLHAVSVDVTDATAFRQELEDDVAFFRRVLESLPEGVVALDQGHKVIACNRRLSELCGFDERIALGVTEAELVRALDARLAPATGLDGAPGDDPAAEPTAREVLRLTDGRVMVQRRTENLERTPLAVWSFRDETTRQAAAARNTCLAQLGRLLSFGRLEERLEHAARTALPVLGQLCAIDRLRDGEAVRVVEVRSATDLEIDPAADLMTIEAADIDTGRGGGPACLSVPIVRRGLRDGTLSFARSPHGKPFDTEDLTFAREIADRLALVIDEGEANAQAQDTILECERLLSIAGHELRGPVTALQLSVQSLMKRDLDVVTTRHVEVIERASRRMSRLINQLLDLGRIRSGQWAVELEPVDLCDLARNVARYPPADAPQAEIPIRVEVTRPSVVGRWDRVSLEQILSNLVGNAIKFGRGRGIEIRVGADERQAWLAVRDHGIGIEQDMQALIFEPFKRAPGVQHVGGLGLGLHIVRTIVTRLGGDIRVESKPGEGATFVVSLPFLPLGADGTS